MGAELLCRYLPAILAGEAEREKQDDSLSCYAPMLTKEEGRADFSRSARELERLVRGMGSWPGVTAYYQDQPMKIREAEVEEKTADSGAGNRSVRRKGRYTRRMRRRRSLHYQAADAGEKRNGSCRLSEGKQHRRRYSAEMIGRIED